MNTEHLKLVESHIVPVLDEKVRLSDYVPGVFNMISSKAGMKKAIKKRLVKVNEKVGTTSHYLKGGETLKLYQELVKPKKPSIELELEILYEDDYLALVNKPAGITVSGNKKWTLENALGNKLFHSKQLDALLRPEPIHRLDYPTSGVLLVGKTIKSVVALNKLFEEREIEKLYYAVTIGKMEKSGCIETLIDNKSSKTIFEVECSAESQKYEFLNLVRLYPYTGRRHQLRKHLSEIGHPILGDKDYGKEGLILTGRGLYLHAFSLSFTHPFLDKKIVVSAPLPKKYVTLFSSISLLDNTD